MKKKNNHILPALVLTASLGLTAVSCNGFLDEMPDNRTELNTDHENSQTACIGRMPTRRPTNYSSFTAITPMTVALPTVTTSFPNKSATTGKIPRKNIRTRPILFGEVTTAQ